MAAPPEKTLHDLTGDWILNRALSSDTDAILAFQGIGWVTRKLVGLATITLHIKEYKDDEGVVRIDIDQTGTGGLKGTSEHRILNWTTRPHKDAIFGEVEGKSRMIKLSELGDECGDEEDRKHLAQNWEDAEGDKIESLAVSESGGWQATQVWGFQDIDGKRYHCRNVVLRKNGESKRERLVYDYAGPNTTAAAE